MFDVTLLVCLTVAFLATFLLVPKWIGKARDMGLVGRDMNKYDKRKVPEAGGVTVIAGAVSGILLYIFLNTFYFSSEVGAVEIFAAHQFEDERFVDAGLGLEVEGVQRL